MVKTHTQTRRKRLRRMSMKSARLGHPFPSAVSSVVPMPPSMTFTALHRVLGLPPGPLTDAMLNEAVEAGAASTEYPKDVAAMANSGGGVIVFGVRETQKASV